MVIVLTKAAKSRLAFHRIRPATVNFMRKTAPSRFDLMNEADADAAVDAAFRLCQRSELAFQDELRFVCMISTLFGHHFYLDRRYDEISHILFNPAQMARRRRAETLVAPLVNAVWGYDRHQGDVFLDILIAQLRIVAEGREAAIGPCTQPFAKFANWRPRPLNQASYVENARAVSQRLRLEGSTALDLCFWTIWVLGLDFDLDPQFAWLTRSVESAGVTPEKRFRRLVLWLIKLAEIGQLQPHGK